ncbi:MAG TPA: family 20 glycosylhydrolase, partial [Puia sp.]|nr:family 20 glycosylhydrolase [Puia sp.]
MRKFFLIVAVCISHIIQAQEPAIIPRPVSAQWQEGHFSISKNTIVLADESERPSASFFTSYLEEIYGLHLAIRHSQEAGAAMGEGPVNYIRLTTVANGASGREGRYQMKVSPAEISITGDTHPGTFYGIQTLIQLLPSDPGVLNIPSVSIEDYPRFGYRGLHLDVGRHFFPVSFVKKYIDYLALHKMNYFHWHLTEDQGWRIEIKKYPRLTEIGSCRSSTIIGH